MSFRQIHLHAFGVFEDMQIDFPSPTGLYLITGENETGKSTLFHAMKTILGGFRPANRDRFSYYPRGGTKASLEALLWDGTRISRQLSASPGGYLIREGSMDALGNAPIAPLHRSWVDQLYSVESAGKEDLEQKDFQRLLEEFLWPKEKGVRSLEEARAYCAKQRRALYTPRIDGKGEINALTREITQLDGRILRAREKDAQILEDEGRSEEIHESLRRLSEENATASAQRDRLLPNHLPLTDESLGVIRRRNHIQQKLREIEEEIHAGPAKWDTSFSPDALADVQPLMAFAPILLLVLVALAAILGVLKSWWFLLPITGALLLLVLQMRHSSRTGLHGFAGFASLLRMKRLGESWDTLKSSLPAMPSEEKWMTARSIAPETIDSFLADQKELQANLLLLSEKIDTIRMEREKLVWELSAIESRRKSYEEITPTGQLEDMREDFLDQAARLDTEYSGWLLAEAFLQEQMDKRIESVSGLFPAAAEHLSRFSGGKWIGIHPSPEGLFLEDASGDMFSSTRQLSRGTADQFLLSLRLAMLETLASQHVFGLLLDEPFAHWDAKREEAGIRVLSQVAAERAVYIFTTEKQKVEAWSALPNVHILRMESLR